MLRGGASLPDFRFFLISIPLIFYWVTGFFVVCLLLSNALHLVIHCPSHIYVAYLQYPAGLIQTVDLLS